MISMEGRTIQCYEGIYFSVPETAKKLRIPASTLRNYLNKDWLDKQGINRKPEAILETMSGRKFIELRLVAQLEEIFYKPIG